MSVMSSVGLFLCGELQANDSTTDEIAHSQVSCTHQEYLVFSWVLCLVALACVLKLDYYIKLLLIMFISVTFIILLVIPEYLNYSVNYRIKLKLKTSSKVPATIQMSILILIFSIIVTYHSKLIELTARLDYIWKERTEHELSRMKSLRSISYSFIEVSL